MSPFTAHTLAACMAAIGAAAMVCGAFFPVLFDHSGLSRRLAALTSKRKPGQDEAPSSNLNINRAQKFALKAVADSKRTRRATRLDARLTAAGLQISPEKYWMGCVVLGVVLFVASLLAGAPLSIAAAASIFIAWFLPGRWLAHLAERRRQKFINGFAAAVDMMVRGIRSGHSVTDCLNVVANDASPPIAKEFSAVVAQLRAGVSLTEAMTKLNAAVPVPELRFFTTVMAMQNQTGGNLSETLGNLSRMLRDRQKLAMKVRTASAEVKASAIAVGSLPFIVAAATSLLAPDYISTLWNDDAGRRVVFMTAGWLCLGVFVLRRMARIEV
ncbi:MAG: type II secretion system F family protein [Alphaproteobacteria bacterium]